MREIPFTAPLFTGNNGEGVREIPFTAPLFTGTQWGRGEGDPFHCTIVHRYTMGKG